MPFAQVDARCVLALKFLDMDSRRGLSPKEHVGVDKG